jgi:hypothetical protein
VKPPAVPVSERPHRLAQRLTPAVPARGRWRWTRTGKVQRTRIWAPWYFFGILAIVTHPRERWNWAGTR